jgi:hypothetical protein
LAPTTIELGDLKQRNEAVAPLSEQVHVLGNTQYMTTPLGGLQISYGFNTKYSVFEYTVYENRK